MKMFIKDRGCIVCKWLPLLLVIIISFIVTMHFSMYGFDPHHDGFMFKTALDVSRGMVMYRDTYSQYGILTTFIQVLFIHIFGEKVWAIRASTTVMYVISYIMVYLIYAKFLNKILSMVACFLILAMAPFYFWVFLPWSSVYALAFLLMSAYNLMIYFEKRHSRWIFLSSAAGICCFFCRQPVGIVTVLSFYIVIALLLIFRQASFRKIRKPLFLYTVVSICLFLFVMVYLEAKGAVKDFWIQNVEYMFRFGKTVGAGEEGTLARIFGSLFTKDIEYYSFKILPLSCVAVLLYFAAKIIVKREKLKKNSLAVCILSVYCIASWHQYYPVTCFRHVFWAAFPMFGVTMFLCTKLFGVFCKKPKVLYDCLAAVAVLLLLYPDLKFRYGSAVMKVNAEYAYVSSEDYGYLEGLKLTQGEADFYSLLQAQVKELEDKYPDKAVTNITRDGYYACFYPYNYQPQFSDWGSMNVYDDYNEKFLAFVEKEKPILIGYDTSEVPGYDMYTTISNIGILLPQGE